MSKIKEYLDKNFKFIPSVVVFVINEKTDEVLLGFRQTTTDNLGTGLYSGLGGKVDVQESYIESNDAAAIREVKEEAGIEISDLEYKGRVRFIFPDKPQSWSQDVAVFVTKSWKGDPHKTEEGKIIPEWVKFSEIDKKPRWDDAKVWWPKVLAGENVEVVVFYEDGKVGEVAFF